MRFRFISGLTVCWLSFGCDPSSDSPHRDHDAAITMDAGSFRTDASIDAGTSLDGAGPMSNDGGGSLLPDAEFYGELPATGWPDCDPLPSEWLFKTLLQASDYGPDAAFVALSGPHVLVTGGSGDQVLTLPAEQGAPVHSPLPSGVKGTAIADAHDSSSAIYVLSCNEAGGSCSVLHAAAAGQSLTALPGGTLPAAFVGRGLSALQGNLCAFGSGALCLRDQSWVSVIDDPAPVGGKGLPDRVVGMALGEAMSLAISLYGKVWYGTRSAVDASVAFAEVAPASVGPLLYVTASGREAFVTSNGFVLAWVAGALHYVSTPFIKTAWLEFDGTEAALLTFTGAVVNRRSRGAKPYWCKTQQIAVPTLNGLLASGSNPCGLASNFRFLTSERLVGQNLCVLD
ncbi:MAG: hypothetical protein JWN04_3438 [Myxococcaceae bacterium]|nr:hypothetical protein [Myxococcaceae bacterium]